MFGLSKQLPCFPITDKIVQGILSMAVRDKVIDRAEAGKMLDEVRQSTGGNGQAEVSGKMDARDGTGSFIIDLHLAIKNKQAATLDVLVDQNNSLAMLAEVAAMVIDGED
jgi:hypothetical protein